ncbi:catabolic 3-dehydroquinase [Tricharina praecox]|uniref:catabolic 3-dehydroquinase n=1 Tax=Tricharina praecox TaxID=43433 RepID=UPI002220925B|nr:catabolic 3-dehydroquinase [Tricharina praecox]KAI5858675.1 catabolic 3-dehydroquinase [Tricharina praecox]
MSEAPRSPKLLLLNGPNLNLLGTREPNIYGHTTLSDVENSCNALVTAHGATLSTFQSNHEGALIDRLHQARLDKVDFVIINPGGFTHTSVALRDAIAGVDIPFIELHISNVHGREPFRHHSYFSDKAVAVIAGLGTYGYEAAIGYVFQLPRFKGAKIGEAHKWGEAVGMETEELRG